MFKSRRPYRHIPTPALVSARDYLFQEVRKHADYTIIDKPFRKELALVSRELDYRSEETS